MKRNPQRIVLAAAVAGAAALVVACGGGGDYAPVPAATEQVPESASTSIDGFIAYLKDLVASSADLLEPVDVSGVRPPSDDTALPDSSI